MTIAKPFSAFFLLILTGCSGGGLFCKAEHPEPAIAELMRSSCRGSRPAALLLGQWFESHAEFETAVHYYEVAATPSGGQTYIYVPAAGDVAGYTLPLDRDPRLPGLAEAQYRLGLMYRDGKGVKQNSRKARGWFQEAANQDHLGAITALAAQ